MPEPPWGEAIKPGFPSMGCSGFFSAAGQVLSVLKNVFLAPGLQIVMDGICTSLRSQAGA
jgi:hypothetical protein